MPDGRQRLDTGGRALRTPARLLSAPAPRAPPPVSPVDGPPLTSARICTTYSAKSCSVPAGVMSSQRWSEGQCLLIVFFIPAWARCGLTRGTSGAHHPLTNGCGEVQTNRADASFPIGGGD